MNRVRKDPTRTWPGIAWTKQLPTRWTIVPGGRLFYESREIGSPDETLLSATQKDGVVPRSELESRVWNPDAEFPEGYKLVRAGDFVISLRSFQGGIELSRHRGLVSPAYTVLRNRAGVESDYLRWAFKSGPLVSTLRSASTGIRQGKSISFEDFRALPVPVPSPGEQRAIARFLDEKTAKVDALIENNAEPVDLAMEARDSRAASLFLGQDLTPMRRVINEICDGPFGSNLKSEHYATRGARVIRLQNIGAGAFLDMDKAYVALEHFDRFGRHEAREGDLLIAGLGDENNRLGRACLVPRGLEPAMVKADCFRLRLTATLALHSFVMHYLNSPSAEPEIVWHSRGATRLRMNGQGIAAVRVPLPPLREQELIVDELNELDQNVRNVRLKSRESSQVLKEYRAALITAAVTGQIDVSGAA